MKKTILFFIMALPLCCFSQVWVSDKAPDIANKHPHPSTVLHVYSEGSSTGVLFPRFLNEDLSNIAIPVDGMILFNTDKKCFMVYSGSDGVWREFGKMNAIALPSGSATEGDVEYSTDENTIWWYNGTEWKEFDTTP